MVSFKYVSGPHRRHKQFLPYLLWGQMSNVLVAVK